MSLDNDDDSDCPCHSLFQMLVADTMLVFRIKFNLGFL